MSSAGRLGGYVRHDSRSPRYTVTAKSHDMLSSVRHKRIIPVLDHGDSGSSNDADTIWIKVPAHGMVTVIEFAPYGRIEVVEQAGEVYGDACVRPWVEAHFDFNVLGITEQGMEVEEQYRRELGTGPGSVLTSPLRDHYLVIASDTGRLVTPWSVGGP